jgi:hypothetical protein
MHRMHSLGLVACKDPIVELFKREMNIDNQAAQEIWENCIKELRQVGEIDILPCHQAISLSPYKTEKGCGWKDTAASPKFVSLGDGRTCYTLRLFVSKVIEIYKHLLPPPARTEANISELREAEIQCFQQEQDVDRYQALYPGNQ